MSRARLDRVVCDACETPMMICDENGEAGFGKKPTHVMCITLSCENSKILFRMPSVELVEVRRMT